MTVIAYDGKTLAADRRTLASNSDILCPPRTKVFVLEGVGAVATCGNAQPDARKREVLTKLQPGANWQGFPEGFTGMALMADGRCVLIGEGYVMPVVAPHALGSGHEVARGAMLAGADAKTAVEITSALVVTCGDGVDTYTPGEAA